MWLEFTSENRRCKAKFFELNRCRKRMFICRGSSLLHEKVALEKVSSSVRYNNGKYSVAVPWKEQRPQLPNNRQMAESCLLSTDRNLKKKEFVEKEYQKTIDTYVKKG